MESIAEILDLNSERYLKMAKYPSINTLGIRQTEYQQNQALYFNAPDLPQSCAHDLAAQQHIVISTSERRRDYR